MNRSGLDGTDDFQKFCGSGLIQIQFYRIRTGLGLKKFTIRSSLTHCSFFLKRWYLAPPSHPGQSTTLLWLERPSSKGAKLHTVAPSNYKDPMSCSFHFCLHVPHCLDFLK